MEMTQAQRRELIQIMWASAYAQVEGPDNSQGEGVDPDAVWEALKQLLARVGKQLDLAPLDEPGE